VDVVELDPELLRIVHERLKEVGRAVFHDHRVKVHVGDGRQFLSRSPEHWDVIVLVAPDPETAALNRFYTEEFFRAARAHLASGGIFSLSARSSEETLSPALAEYLQSMKKTLDVVFPYVVAIPGDTMHFVAAAQSGVLTESARILAERIQERKLSTQYVSEYFLPYRMSPERMAEARAQLQPTARTRVNRDFHPVAYYENAVLWSGQFHSRFAQWLTRASQVHIEWVLGVSALLSLAAMLIGLRGKRAAALIAMGSTGFTMMAAQVFLLLGFQAVCGYVYQELALLIGLTMAGMALGSGWAMRRADRVAPVQIALAALLPVLMGAVALLANTESNAAAQLLFPALAAAAGLLGGVQFPRLVALWTGDDDRGASALYAVDLIGGCAAALVVSAYLIPVFGFWPAAWTCALIGAGPAFATMRR
jgi:spermidine synthase